MTARHPELRLGASLTAALVGAVCGAALLTVLSPFAGPQVALRVAIAVLGFGYVVYTVGASGERVGRITTVALWTAAAGGAWLAGLPLPAYLLAHVGLLWLVRSLYYYSGVLPALADLALSGLALAFGVWAAARSGSALLAFWCFFFVQTLHVLIPESIERARRGHGDANAAFERAYRAADAAARRLSGAR